MTDLDMPGLRGDVLAARVQQFDREFPVVLLTAAWESASAISGTWAAVVRKPFTIASLLGAVADALAVRQAG